MTKKLFTVLTDERNPKQGYYGTTYHEKEQIKDDFTGIIVDFLAKRLHLTQDQMYNSNNPVYIRVSKYNWGTDSKFIYALQFHYEILYNGKIHELQGFQHGNYIIHDETRASLLNA
jgi:hypothetical protein